MKKRNIIEDEVFEEIEAEASQINNKDLNVIVLEEKKINNKSTKLDLNKFKKLINQLKLAISLIKDFKDKNYTQIPWRSIALIGASILYFLNPFDVVPDILPVFGIADDAILFATVFKSIQVDLERYCEWKGFSKKEYF